MSLSRFVRGTRSAREEGGGGPRIPRTAASARPDGQAAALGDGDDEE
ncbi:hypothetical protein [Streptomyces sp. NPDC058463]